MVYLLLSSYEVIRPLYLRRSNRNEIIKIKQVFIKKYLITGIKSVILRCYINVVIYTRDTDRRIRVNNLWERMTTRNRIVKICLKIFTY